ASSRECADSPGLVSEVGSVTAMATAKVKVVGSAAASGAASATAASGAGARGGRRPRRRGWRGIRRSDDDDRSREASRGGAAQQQAEGAGGHRQTGRGVTQRCHRRAGRGGEDLDASARAYERARALGFGGNYLSGDLRCLHVGTGRRA